MQQNKKYNQLWQDMKFCTLPTPKKKQGCIQIQEN